MPIDLPTVQRAYDQLAWAYDLTFGAILQPGRNLLAKKLSESIGATVVEFGAGSGLMLPLYPSAWNVTGVDLSKEMLRLAARRVASLALDNVTLELIDAEHSNLPAREFDHVVLPYVYSVTPDPAALMIEAFRVCRPGGSIWVLNHFSGFGMWRWLEAPLKPLARWIGWRSDFPFSYYVSAQGWDIAAVYSTNIFGLSRLIQIRCPNESTVRVTL